MPTDMTGPNGLRRFIDIGVQGTFRNDLAGVQQEKDTYEREGVNRLIQSYVNRPKTKTRPARLGESVPDFTGPLSMEASVAEPVSPEDEYNELINTVGALNRWGDKGKSAASMLIQTARARKDFIPKQSTALTFKQRQELQRQKDEAANLRTNTAAAARIKASKNKGGDDEVATREKERLLRELVREKEGLQGVILDRYKNPVVTDYEYETDAEGKTVLNDKGEPKLKFDAVAGKYVSKPPVQYDLTKILEGKQPIPKMQVGDRVIEDPDVVNYIKKVHEYEAEMKQQGKEFKPATSGKAASSDIVAEKVVNGKTYVKRTDGNWYAK